MSSHNVPEPSTFEKIKQRINTLRNAGSSLKTVKPTDAPLGTGMADDAAKKIGGRKKQIDDAVDAATR